MSQLDVTAVEEISPDPDAPEYVLYGGKGGVGKTTMAAATALASAGDGIETLVVSTDPAHSLSDVLGTEVPPDPTEVHPEYPLYGAEIDPDAAMAETTLFDEGGGLGGLGGMSELLPGEEDADAGLTGGMPGADEAAAMQQLLRFLDDDRFERVVIDTAPTGHTLRLLELPDVMDSMLGRVLSLRERFSEALAGMPGPFGGEADEGADLDDLEVLRERIERLRSVLRDPDRTDFRIVLVPEEMSVIEAGRLRRRLREFDIPVGTVVVNRVMEDLSDVVAADLEAPEAFVTPDLEDCAFCQRRWAVQQDALERAHDLFRDHAVRRVPLFADEVRGERMLRLVAACLRG